METPFIFGKIATEKNFTDRETEKLTTQHSFTDFDKSRVWEN